MNYLYNGVELPALPGGLYPFAGIYKNPGHRLTEDEKENGVYYYLVAHESQNYFGRISDGVQYERTFYGSENGYPRAIIYRMRLTDTGWSLTDATEWNVCVEFGWLNYDIIWTNFPLYQYYSGAIRKTLSEPSDPIPVSSFTPDPISMTMGWLVGRRIAGQRK